MLFHIFTQLWQTSAFKGIGNIWPMKLLLTDKAFQAALSKLGDSWEVSTEEFTTTMNSRVMYKSVNAARLGKSMVVQMVPKSTSATHETY